MRTQSSTAPKLCAHCSAPLADPRKTYCSRRCRWDVESIPLETRFWAKVDKAGPLPPSHPEFGPCWIWTAATHSGYGTIGRRGSIDVDAHRWALESASGQPLSEGLMALHTCDVRACVRNDEIGFYEVNGVLHPRYGHLWAGTYADNSADMWAKGRGTQRGVSGDRSGSRLHPESRPRGERSWNSKITDDMVREIRTRYAAGGIRQVDLAREYGIKQAQVSTIVRRVGWKHV